MAPFEPLHKISLKHLSMKTAFLIALASGQRVSSLHALSAEEGHIRSERSGVCLVPSPGFIAKNQTPSSGSIEIFLPPISSISSETSDKVWCLVRTLKWYLDRTKALVSGRFRAHDTGGGGGILKVIFFFSNFFFSRLLPFLP